MPVFESKNLDSAFEGQALLAAILHPTREAQDRALRLGRRRIERPDPLTLAARFPTLRDGLAVPASVPVR